MLDAGVGHRDVEATMPFHDVIKRGGLRGFVGHVEGGGFGTPADAFDARPDRIKGDGVARVEHHQRACPRIALGNRCTQAARGAGDERDAPCKRKGLIGHGGLSPDAAGYR